MNIATFPRLFFFLDVCFTITAVIYKASFPIGRYLNLISFFHKHCTTSEAVSFSWMFVLRLQQSNIRRLSLSAETAIWFLSFENIAPHLRMFLSLGCLFYNCNSQISGVFLYRKKPQSDFFLSKTLHHIWGCFFLLVVCFTIATVKYQASFSIGRNRNLISFFQKHCTTFEAVSFSWMFDSKLQEPKLMRSSMAANG